jgi:sulfur carrier protein
MKIYINNKPAETAATTLEALAGELNLPDHGVAMAVGTQMVQRTAWADTVLKEDDSIVIIKAACGG